MSFDEELLEKRKELLAGSIDAYPYSFRRSHTLAEVRPAGDLVRHWSAEARTAIERARSQLAA